MYGRLKGYPQRHPFLCGEGDSMGSASWVRMPQSEYARLGICERADIEDAFFTLRVTVDAVPERAPVRVSAVNRYRLFVNGVSCAFGPRKGDAFSWYYDSCDIAPLLKPGVNLVAAYVTSATAKALQVREGGVLSATSIFHGIDAVALVLNGQIGETDISTGVAPWRVRMDVSKSHHYYAPADLLGSYEDVDLRRYPAGWTTDADLSADWLPAETLFKPGCNYYGQMRALPLLPRPIAPMEESPRSFVGQIAPSDGDAFRFNDSGVARIGSHRKVSCILDPGVHTTAFIRTGLSGTGARVRYTYAESFALRDERGALYKERRDDARGVIAGATDEIVTSGDTAYEPFWFRTFRFVQIDVETGDAPLEIRMPALRRTGYPLKVESWVKSSDDDINWLWATSLNTLRNCMHETFEDGPFYEQLQYVMDSKLQMDFVYALSRDIDFPSATLWDFHSSLRPDGMIACSAPSNETQIIPGFCLHYIWMLERYYHHTADARTIAFYRPTMDAILAYFDRHIGDSGLCEWLGYWEFGDWSREWNACHGRPNAIQHGPSTLFNLMYALSLQLAGRLNRETGRPGVAQEYEARAAAILGNVQHLCWVESRGLYCEAPGFQEFSQHAQVLAVLTGLVEGAPAKALLERMLADGDIVECSLPWRYYLFRALERYGLYDQMRRWLDSFSALRKFGFTTMPEWGFEGSRSDCHAWSATPLYELTATLLGVRPCGDGWKKIRIRPRTLGYADCRGEVVTPHGPVKVRWKSEGGQLKLDVETPFESIVEMPDERVYCVQPGIHHFESALRSPFQFDE